MRKTYLIFFGPQGSGKGTQAEMLSEKLKLPILATGELFRQEIEKGSKIGKALKPLVEQGKIVNNKIFEKLITQHLSNKKAKKGIIFDGYPRDIEQQDFLITLLSQIADKKDYIYVVLVDISDKEAKHRLGGRRSCDCGEVYHLKYNPPRKAGICDSCGQKLHIRDDDKPKIIDKRLKLYHRETSSLLDYWQQAGKLIKINGEQTIEKVHNDIIKKLKEKGIVA